MEAAMFYSLFLKVLHLFVSLFQTRNKFPIRNFQTFNVAPVKQQCTKLQDK